MGSRKQWLSEVGAILGIAALVCLKLRYLIAPGAQPNPYLGGDFGLAIEPYFYHLLQRGTIPLWDPTLGTGSPLLGGGTHHPMFEQAHLHLFYPLNLLWLGLAQRGQFIPHIALQHHHVFHYFLAGLFTYVYGRVLGLIPCAAALSAIAFAFSGFMLTHASHWTFIDCLVWLPLVLACAVRADATDRLQWGALAGLFLGIAFLAGQPQIFYYVSLTTVALCLTLLGRRRAAGQPWRRLAAALLLVPIVALGIAAVQLLPSWQIALESHRAKLDYDWKSVGSLSPHLLLHLLLPQTLESLENAQGFFSEFYTYAGVLPLILAGYALSRQWDWRIAFHAVVGLVAALLAFGANYPLYRLTFDLLPGMHLFRIPARILCLVNLTVAILAGLGAHALLAEKPSHRLRRFLTGAVVVTGAGSIPLLFLLLWTQGGPAADSVRSLSNQYVVLLLLLGMSLLTVAWRADGHSPALVKSGLIVTLCVDLLFGSFSIEGGWPNPDLVSPADQEVVEFLRTQPGPFRISRGQRLPPRLIYQYGWGVFDGESTFAPPGFLDLYFLREENPRLLDLLNVKYLVEERLPETTAVQPWAQRLWPGAVRRVAVPADYTGRRIELDSHLVYAAHVRQGTTVAVLHVIARDGSTHAFPLRAGIETAEWAIDAASPPAHLKPPIARSWPVPGQAYQGHSYRTTVRVPPRVRPAQLVFERRGEDAVLVLERIRLDERTLPAPAERFRLVHPRLYENRYALPRAFLIRSARRVPPALLLEQLRSLDPEEELLLTDPVPSGWQSAPVLQGSALPPVRVAAYTPHYVRLETIVAEPLFLLLSDTYDPGWRAWDNGQPTTIFRADHALRALALTPGRHVIEFRYRQPSFWIGLAISLATLGALSAGGLAAFLRRRRQRPDSSQDT